MQVSILSQRVADRNRPITPAGKIRPGIKVLTTKAKENTAAKRIYAEGVMKRLKFSEIEKEITKVTGLENPLYPMNTRYFTVSTSDFGMPEVVAAIIGKYGEMRDGDTEPRLYRFPVVFHSDNLADIYPNKYKRYGGTPSYESTYGEDGQRYCKYLPELTKEDIQQQRAQRITRMPRRSHLDMVVRGKCDPKECAEFRSGQCKFRGRLHFYIPGVPTTGLLAMETTSEGASEHIWEALYRIYEAFKCIPRINPSRPGQPIFYITKVQELRTYFDKDGIKRQGLQWVPKLESEIDIGHLLSTEHDPVHIPVKSAEWQPPPVETPPPALMQPSDEDDVTQETVDELILQTEELGVSRETVLAYFDTRLGGGWKRSGVKVRDGFDLLLRLKKVCETCARKLIVIAIKVGELQLQWPDFQAYIIGKYGLAWAGNDAILEKVINDLLTLQDMGTEMAKAYIAEQVKALEAEHA